MTDSQTRKLFSRMTSHLILCLACLMECIKSETFEFHSISISHSFIRVVASGKVNLHDLFPSLHIWFSVIKTPTLKCHSVDDARNYLSLLVWRFSDSFRLRFCCDLFPKQHSNGHFKSLITVWYFSSNKRIWSSKKIMKYENLNSTLKESIKIKNDYRLTHH